MKTLIVAKIPTHHTSNALRGLSLENYKQFPTGVHQAFEDFRTLKEAKEHLKDRLTHEVNVQLLTGLERLEYKDFNYLEY